MTANVLEIQVIARPSPHGFNSRGVQQMLIRSRAAISG
jgi:hypothetical protein